MVVVKTVSRVTTTNTTTNTTTRYYITSLRTLPVAAGIRRNWGIEHKLHLARDVHFDQDTNGTRHPGATVNIFMFNILALNYLLLPIQLTLSYAQLYFAQNFRQPLSKLRR